MGWTEHHDGATTSGDLVGLSVNQSVDRLFIVEGDLYPDVVISAPGSVLGGPDGATPLPLYGSSHPRIPGINLFRYTVTGQPPLLRVVAQYRTPQVSPVDPEFFSQSGDWNTVQDELPMARRVRKLVTVGGDVQTQQEIWPFEFGNIVLESSIRQHRMSVNIGGLIGDAVNAMDNQNGHIHVLNGSPYLFKAGGFNEIRPSTWVVNYIWEKDSGTPYDQSMEDLYQPNSDIVLPFFVVGGAPPSPEHPGAVTSLGRNGVKYLRLPFHRRLIAPNPSGDPEAYPLFPHVLPYVFDPNGWQELVGL